MENSNKKEETLGGDVNPKNDVTINKNVFSYDQCDFVTDKKAEFTTHKKRFHVNDLHDVSTTNIPQSMSSYFIYITLSK